MHHRLVLSAVSWGIRRSWALLFGLCGVLVGGAVSRTCGDDELKYYPRPAMLWDGRMYAMAWIASKGEDDGRRGTMYIRRVPAGGARAANAETTSVAVYKDDDLQDPQLVQVGDGFVALATRPREGADHPQERDIVSVPLDRTGHVSGKPTFSWSLHANRFCRASGSSGDRGFVGLGKAATSHRHPYDYLFALALDRNGEQGSVWLLDTNLGGDRCALASRGDLLAVAWTNAGSRRMMYLGFLGLRDGMQVPPELELRADAHVDAIVPYHDDWAVLYLGDEKPNRLHVALAHTTKGIYRTYDLPPDVDSDTVDLGVNTRGHFVTWHTRGKVHIRGLEAGAAHLIQRSTAPPTPTRAVGHGEQCAVAWSARNGKDVELWVARACP
jgi:hypothetical protein